MIIPNSIFAFLSEDFVLWSGKRGDALVRRDSVTLSLGEDEMTFPLTVDNVQMALWAIE